MNVKQIEVTETEQEATVYTAQALDISEISRREEMVEVQASICICSCWF